MNTPETEMYGKDAAEWLKRWDEGKSVWSIEMGGLGPGYEQCIQIITAQILRHLLSSPYDHKVWKDDKAAYEADREKIDQFGFTDPVIQGLGGITGAQWGAALNLAAMLWMHGPVSVMKDDRVADRHILVSKNFPGAST